MRRLTRWGGATAILALGAGGALFIDVDPPPDVVAGGGVKRSPPIQQSTPPRPHLSIDNIEIEMGRVGVDRIVLRFSDELPDPGVTYLADIDDYHATGIAYSTQEYTPENPTPLLTCGNQHFGFSPPAVVGQVDILLPARWFGGGLPDLDEIPTYLDGEWYPKSALCAPRAGGIQYAIWSPSSHDPRDIRVHVEYSNLVIETHPRQ